MPPLVLPTHLFGGICRGHVTSWNHCHSRLPRLRVRAAQALPVKGVPKGEAPLVNLWPLSFDQESGDLGPGRCLTVSQTTALPMAQGKKASRRFRQIKDREKRSVATGWGPPAPKERRTAFRHEGASLTDLPAGATLQGPPGPPPRCRRKKGTAPGCPAPPHGP